MVLCGVLRLSAGQGAHFEAEYSVLGLTLSVVLVCAPVEHSELHESCSVL